MINVEELFKETIDKLKNDVRPQIKFSDSEHEFLNQKWSEARKTNSNNIVFKILCLLDNTISLNKIYEHNILGTLKSSLNGKLDRENEEITVLTLGICIKHITGAYHKDSKRVPLEILDTFKELLKIKSPEIKEWTLRNIEALGSQSAYLKKEVLDSKPNLLQLFNEHNKACAQIIELLEKRWNVSL